LNKSHIHDKTDHFSFMCEDCKKIAEITRIQSSDDIVRFYLQCKICGKAGIRKIYVMHELPFLEMSGKKMIEKIQ